jgi:L-ascorbate metabolism protein UlaG (beta-lactamase superfamily)
MRETQEKTMRITWLGHSGFRIEIEQAVLLVDPWLTGQPLFPQDRRAEAVAGVTHILLTHGHGDHASDTLRIARETGVSVACNHELSEWWNAEEKDVATIGFGKGGTIELGGAKVTMVHASHSSSTDYRGGRPVYAGSAAGYMIAGEGQVIYVSGDTDLMADMEWMADVHKPTIGILSAGGHYTMDMARAAYACRRWFHFHTVIPCHYKTFPILAQDAEPLRKGLLPGVRLVEPEVMVPIVP